MAWDRIFGIAPDDDAVPLRCGLVRPAGPHNPFVIVFGEFRGMLRDVRGARGWSDRLAFLFRRPGWQPPGPGRPVSGAAGTQRRLIGWNGLPPQPKETS